jgi:hypothetical protein
MKVINSKRQVSSMTHFGELISFDKHNVDIKSDYDFTKNLSQYNSVEDKSIRNRTANLVSPFNTLLAQQREIKKLQNKIKKLQNEKSVLVKWVQFLF